MTPLNIYGWNPRELKHTGPSTDELIVGRVISIQGFKFVVITASGEKDAELAGKLLYGVSPEDLPKLGDWVFLKDYDPTGYIVEVLPRMNELSRRNPGKAAQKQVMAANIDIAIVVQGLDRDFNLMRMDRYLVQLASCNIQAVVVLNKSDLIDAEDPFRADVARLQRNCPVYFCSTRTGAGLEEFQQTVLEQGKTYIMLGSSGVGKSSLLNALMTRKVQEVNAISDFNNKGKHTTARRDLFLLPNGSLVIDTPGMREFGLTTVDEQTTTELFPALAEFAVNCRFSDCTHMQEEGCAVLQAVHDGRLDPDLHESYVKLWKEQQRFSISAEDRKRINRQGGRLQREASSYRKKHKF